MSLLLLVSSQGIRIHLCLRKSFLREEFIDAGCVLGAPNSRLKRHLMFLPGNSVPINIHEERVPLQVDGVVFSANTFGRITFQKLLEETRSLRREIMFHWYRLLRYVSQHLLAILVVVWWTTTEHFVEQGTQTPPVGSP